jgi:hypothetical protein
MAFLLLGKHLLWSRPDGHGGTMTYYYYDAITWIAGALALTWLICFLVIRYRRARAMRRPARRVPRSLKRISRLKRQLSDRYLGAGFSANIHAIGIGNLPGATEQCIQVFVNDAAQELWPGATASDLPPNFGGVPLRLIEMPTAGFLSAAAPIETPSIDQFPKGIRDRQELIVGGISGANSNLAGQSGTIGYFCRRKTKLRRRQETLLLSNAHVFADLRKTRPDETDLIMQPSPGEPGAARPIADLVDFTLLNFDGELKRPNHVDAAIARLWPPQQHKQVIPMIGAVKGFVEKDQIELGEATQKFGRTTGFTVGYVFSICVDIRISYARTGGSAFFRDQILIAPAMPQFTKFVAAGDSGSLLVDAGQHAIGLIFAGTAELPESVKTSAPSEGNETTPSAADKPERIEGYGVANPISEVLDRLKIELLI